MGRRKKTGSGYKGIIVLFFIIGAAFIAGGLRMASDELTETGGEAAKSQIPYQAAAKEETSLQSKFYYEQLNEEEKAVYREVLQGVRDNVEEIYLHEEDAEKANKIFQNVLDDWPGIFWCDGNATTTSFGGTGAIEYVVLKPVYSYGGTEKEEKQNMIDLAVAECISQISADATEYDKIKYVYEYLINTVEYQLDAPDNQNIVSALINKVTVCAGYAKGTQYLLEQLSVYCTYVTGTATDTEGNTEDHAWNLVQCDGEYYYVDTTWGDPVYRQESADIQNPGISYDYLCCSSAELEKTHTADNGVVYPECTSEALNYYRLNGMYYEIYDEVTFLDDIRNSIEQQESMTVFKFSDETLYQQAEDAVIGDLVKQGAQYLGALYGLQEIKYYYEENPRLNKITLYWMYE